MAVSVLPAIYALRRVHRLRCRAMGFYSWLLALHLLAAFAIAAALVLYSVLVVSGRRMTTLEETRLLFRLAPIGVPLIGAG